MTDRKPLPTAETCETCRFWDQWEYKDSEQRANDLGACRRHAPRPRAFSLDTVTGESEETYTFASEWPNTYGHDWCGEHQPTTVATDTAAG